MFKPLSGKGVLSLNGKEIKTPNFIIPTIRGAVPHLTPDNYPKIPLGALFTEHFVDQHGFATEAAKISVLNADLSLVALRPPNGSILQKPNTDSLVGISTFQGTQLINAGSLAEMMNSIGAHIVVAPHDSPNKEGTPGKNRQRKMVKRSEDWLKIFSTYKSEKSMLLATITEDLVKEEYWKQSDGVYSLDSTVRVPQDRLRVCGCRLSLGEIKQLVGHFDIFYPNIDVLTDQGIALINEDETIDLKDSKYATDMSELGTTGYTLAYVHHLLDAREMTAHIILQKNNLQVTQEFFAKLQ